MTSKDKHQKHVALNKPSYGEFARNELAILGTSCSAIQELVNQLSDRLIPSYQLAYVDKEHGDEEGEKLKMVSWLEKNGYTRLDTHRPLSPFDKRRLLKDRKSTRLNSSHV